MFVSRQLTREERKYCTREREALAILYCIERLRHYLYGVRFTVRTDHRNLQWLFENDTTGRLSRWALRLSTYNFNLVYREGKKMVVPDTLSRTLSSASVAAVFLLYQYGVEDDEDLLKKLPASTDFVPFRPEHEHILSFREEDGINTRARYNIHASSDAELMLTCCDKHEKEDIRREMDIIAYMEAELNTEETEFEGCQEFINFFIEEEEEEEERILRDIRADHLYGLEGTRDKSLDGTLGVQDIHAIEDLSVGEIPLSSRHAFIRALREEKTHQNLIRLLSDDPRYRPNRRLEETKDEWKYEDDVLWKRVVRKNIWSKGMNRTEWKLYVPELLREKLILLMHRAPLAGHMGRERTLEAIARRFWWPKMGE